MKKTGYILIAGLAALAIAGTASAQTITLRITGAQADRKSINAAITHILNPGFVYGYAGATLTGANQTEFQGTTIVGNIPVDIKTSLIGSTGGIQALANGLTITSWFNSTNLTVGGTANLTGPTESALPDATTAATFQSSTKYTAPTLVDHVTGVLPLVWARNAGSPNTITNVTSLLAQILLGTGQIPLSQVTGLNADEGVLVTAIGRDVNAGQRDVAFAESGFGIFSPPFQYQITISGTPGPGGTITGAVPWPVNTVNGTTYPVGHSGYSTSSALAAVLNTPGSLAGTGGWLISYLARDDAASLTLGATLLYNGVAYTDTAVREGQYTFWTYGHFFYTSSLSGNAKTVADQLITQIKTVDAAASGILLSTMQVGRSVEGGAVTFGNPY